MAAKAISEVKFVSIFQHISRNCPVVFKQQVGVNRVQRILVANLY